MLVEVYIVADRNGNCRMTKRTPVTERNEIAVAVSIEIPNSCFLPAIVRTPLIVLEEDAVQPTALVTARRRNLNLKEDH